MSISKYEAAALYHYVSQQLESDKKYLVLDLDDSSYGYCECGNKNRTRLYHSWSSMNINLWEEFIKIVRKLVDNNYPYDIEAESQAQMAAANSSFQSYYLSDRTVNGEALVFSNFVITCENLEKELRLVRVKIEELISRVKEQVSDENLMEADIIVLGKAQEVFPIMYCVREFISSDPLLPDARFKNDELRDSYSEIVRLGKEYLEALKTLKCSYVLMGFDAVRNAVVPIWSVEKGQQEMEINKLSFSPPVLVAKGDKLAIKKDATTLEIAIPYSFAPMDSDLIEIAIGVQDSADTLFIRRCRFQTRIYNVKLS